MATLDYAGIRDGEVKKALDTAGQDVTVRLWSAGTYNPTTGTSTPSYTEKTVRAVVAAFKAHEIDGTEIQRGDKRCIMLAVDTSGGAFSVDTTDTVTVGGAAHEVVSVEEVSPAGTPVIYKAQIRGSG